MVAAGVVEGWQALDAEIHFPLMTRTLRTSLWRSSGRVTIMKSSVSARPSGEKKAGK